MFALRQTWYFSLARKVILYSFLHSSAGRISLRSVVSNQFRKELHIIKMKSCISSTVWAVAYHQCESVFYTRQSRDDIQPWQADEIQCAKHIDDIPLLSQWIKNKQVEWLAYFWQGQKDLKLLRNPSCGARKLLPAWSAGTFRPRRFVSLASSATGGARDLTRHSPRASGVQVLHQIILKPGAHHKMHSRFLAGAEGLEPSALGFGDRCSTNWAIPLFLLLDFFQFSVPRHSVLKDRWHNPTELYPYAFSFL